MPSHPFALVIPTLNARRFLPALLPAIQAQAVQPGRILVVDSQSDDGTAAALTAAGAEVVTIPRSQFDHGGTRQLALEHAADAEVVLYLTQDAIPADPGSFAALLAAFAEPDVAVAYGRQLPHPGASSLGAKTRAANYPDSSSFQTLDLVKQRGIRATFCSDSFAAWRREAVLAVGGFPRPVIWGEDALLATKLMMAGYRKAYVAEARVFHSHDHTLAQHFQLAFDAGVSHAENPWFLSLIGNAEGEGARFALKQLRLLASDDPLSLPMAVTVLAARMVGYRLGRNQAALPPWLRQRACRNKAYWAHRARFIASQA